MFLEFTLTRSPIRARIRRSGGGALILLGLTACLAADGTPDEAPPDSLPTTPNPPPPTPDPPPSSAVDVASRTAQLKRKDGARLANDLAQALELPRTELCAELGTYDCVNQAHRIVLGGVEPYELRVDTPLSVTPVTAPIAADRLALSACGTRAQRDFAGPAVVFEGLVANAPDGPAAAVQALYDRLLGRTPDPHELALLTEFAGEVPNRQDYATLACFVVATSSEFIFY